MWGWEVPHWNSILMFIVMLGWLSYTFLSRPRQYHTLSHRIFTFQSHFKENPLSSCLPDIRKSLLNITSSRYLSLSLSAPVSEVICLMMNSVEECWGVLRVLGRKCVITTIWWYQRTQSSTLTPVLIIFSLGSPLFLSTLSLSVLEYLNQICGGNIQF